MYHNTCISRFLGTEPKIFFVYGKKKGKRKRSQVNLTRENWLDAVEQDGEGQQDCEFAGCVNYNWASGEEEGELVMKDQDQ